MGMVRHNVVEDVLGIGIYCGDYSHCDIRRNIVRGTRANPRSSDRMTHGHAILSHFYAQATVDANVLEGNANDMRAAASGRIRYR